MKLKTYLAALEDLVKKDPKVLDMEVRYAADDEGNEFLPTHFTASIIDPVEGKKFVCLN